MFTGSAELLLVYTVPSRHRRIKLPTNVIDRAVNAPLSTVGELTWSEQADSNAPSRTRRPTSQSSAVAQLLDNNGDAFIVTIVY